MRINAMRNAHLLIAAGLTLVMAVCLSSAGQTDAAGPKTQSPIPASADDICPVKIGAKLPALGLTTVDGKAFDIQAAVAKKPTVLIFYRGGW